MTLLAGTLYDPSTLATKATSALLAMTALDTTNLRLSFTVPANGAVLVRIRCAVEGSSTPPKIYLGVLEGSTVRARVLPLGRNVAIAATGRANFEALFVVPGLTPSASLTWDAAYAVETAVASSSIRYGGPNDTTTDNAAGGFAFEIYDCENLLGAVLYDPASRTTKACNALLAMTAIDTTNLRIVFTAPASGNVLVRIRSSQTQVTGVAQVLFGVLEGSTIKGRIGASGVDQSSAFLTIDGTFLVKGLTPSSSYTFDAAYGVEVTNTGTLEYGGPNDTTATNAAGAILYEIWAV